MDYEAIRVDVTDDGIATLTLDRPEAMNAWNGTMSSEFEHAIKALDVDDAVRVVVLTGAGRAFCAGADLSAGADSFAPKDDGAVPDDQPNRRTTYADAFWPHMMCKPVIAAINGHAIGVGITLPMTCDVRFVAENAKIQFAFTRRGMIPELGTNTIVPRILGMSNAADLMLSGRMFSGKEAVELGVATRALPAEEVLPAAQEYAKEYLLAAPASVAITKRLLWETVSPSISQTMQRESKLFDWTAGQPDATEGIMSFIEKRTPVWSLRPSKDLPEEL